MTRLRVVQDDKGEAKFNPNHDPDNGQFTFAPGGAGSGGDTTDKPVGDNPHPDATII